MDYRNLLRRYIGRRVCVSTFGQVKLWGILGSVADDCVRLTDTITASELDDSPWNNPGAHDDDDSRVGSRHPETLLHFHHIVAITCTEARIDPPGESSDDDNSGEIVFNPLRSETSDAGDDASAQAAIWPFSPADRVTLLLAPNLIKLASAGGALLDRMGDCRRAFIEETGLPLPLVRIRDDIRLPDHHFRILIDHADAGGGVVHANRKMAVIHPAKPGTSASPLEGIHDVEPTFGTPVVWIAHDRVAAAEKAGHVVVDPATVISTAVASVCRKHLRSFLTLDLVRGMLQQVRAHAPTLVDEIAPPRVPLARLRELLAHLAEENVTLRPIEPILESFASHIGTVENPIELLELVRAEFHRQIVQPYRDQTGTLHVFALVEEDCDRFIQLCRDPDKSPNGPREIDVYVAELAAFVHSQVALGRRFCFAVAPRQRRLMWELLRSYLSESPVLAFTEIPREVPLVDHNGEPPPREKRPKRGSAAKKGSMVAVDKPAGKHRASPSSPTSNEKRPPR